MTTERTFKLSKILKFIKHRFDFFFKSMELSWLKNGQVHLTFDNTKFPLNSNLLHLMLYKSVLIYYTDVSEIY